MTVPTREIADELAVGSVFDEPTPVVAVSVFAPDDVGVTVSDDADEVGKVAVDVCVSPAAPAGAADAMLAPSSDATRRVAAVRPVHEGLGGRGGGGRFVASIGLNFLASGSVE
jgi:hypothetical protein